MAKPIQTKSQNKNNNKKQYKQSILTKLMGKHRSRLLVFIGAFALIGGIYYLYSSFAATQIVYFRPGDALAYNNTPGLTILKGHIESVSSGSGKKATTKNYLRLQFDPTKNIDIGKSIGSLGGQDISSFRFVEYQVQLPQGRYSACANVKLQKNGSINIHANPVGQTSSNYGTGSIYSTNNSGSSNPITLNQFQKICTTFGTDGNKEMLIKIDPRHSENNNGISSAFDVIIDDFSIVLYDTNFEANQTNFEDIIIQTQAAIKGGDTAPTGMIGYLDPQFGLINHLQFRTTKDINSTKVQYNGKTYQELLLTRPDDLAVNASYIYATLNKPMEENTTPLSEEYATKKYDYCILAKGKSSDSSIDVRGHTNSGINNGHKLFADNLKISPTEYKTYCVMTSMNLADFRDGTINLYIESNYTSQGKQNAVSVIDAYFKLTE